MYHEGVGKGIGDDDDEGHVLAVSHGVQPVEELSVQYRR